MSKTSTVESDRMAQLRLMLRDLTVTTAMLHAKVDAKLGVIGQNLSRWQAMTIYATEPTTVPNVARTMNQSRQYIQRITDDLARDGHVVARPNPAHRRSPLISATPSGRGLLDEMERAAGGWTHFLGEELLEHEVLAFRATLARLRDLSAAYDLREFQAREAD